MQTVSNSEEKRPDEDNEPVDLRVNDAAVEDDPQPAGQALSEELKSEMTSSSGVGDKLGQFLSGELESELTFSSGIGGKCGQSLSEELKSDFSSSLGVGGESGHFLSGELKFEMSFSSDAGGESDTKLELDDGKDLHSDDQINSSSNNEKTDADHDEYV